MNLARGLVSLGMLVCGVTLVATCWSTVSLAQPADKGGALVGAWTLNKELSDQPQNAASSGDGRRGGGRRGDRGGGGFGRGGRNGGFRGGNNNIDPDSAARQREAMRDIINPADHLTIVSTDTLIVITASDGRTTRLSPDGKSIKEQNTKIERKTRWDGTRLVSEISGLGPGKVTETYSVDLERHQLHITAKMEGSGGGQVRTISHVYDFEPR